MAIQFLQGVDPTSALSISDILTNLKKRVGPGFMPIVHDMDTGKVHYYDRVNSAVRQVATLDGTETFTNKTLTAPTITSPTITGATISGSIAGDNKTLAADAAITSSAALASLTGMNWDLVAGASYQFEIEGPVTMTTNGGLALAFKLTTLTLTSIAIEALQFTAAAVAVAANFTTTTDQAKFVDQKAVAYTFVRITGSLVVNAAGNIAVQAAQNTSHIDTTTLLKGFKARFTRTA